MPRQLKTHCKRGHRFTASNTKLKKLSSGYTVRQCKRCRTEFERLRYHSSPARQAAVRARALTRYYEARP